MTGFTTTDQILSETNGRCIELLHYADDPCVWIIRESNKFLWFRWRSSSAWFFTKQQAMEFALRKSKEQHV